MKTIICIPVLLMLCIGIATQAQIITTYAGSGTSGFSGDGGQATAAQLHYPSGVAIDASHNLYISDEANARVRKVTPAGIISTIAGSTGAGFSGDGGPATDAQLFDPIGIDVDTAGNIFIADFGNNRIRKVTPAGIITTVAGSASFGYSGDGGPATAAEFNGPEGVSVDGTGNIYIADRDNNRVRKVNAAGIINTIAGTGTVGFSGDGGQATDAEIYNAWGVVTDAEGNVYIADANNSRIRKVTPAGIISTYAGNGLGTVSGDGGPATDAGISQPTGICLDGAGNLFISTQGASQAVRKVTTAGIISTVAGNDTFGYRGDGGPATAAELGNPYDVAVDNAGNIYIADLLNNRVRMVNACGLAGITGGDSVCPGTVITLNDPMGGGTWITTDTGLATISAAGVVTGVTPGTVVIEYVLVNSCGSDTAVLPFIVRTMASCTEGVENFTNISTGINIYPNPGNGSFTLSLSSPNTEQAQLTITNILGEKVNEQTVATNKETEIRLNVPAGIYFISAATSSGRVCEKIVVE